MRAGILAGALATLLPLRVGRVEIEDAARRKSMQSEPGATRLKPIGSAQHMNAAQDRLIADGRIVKPIKVDRHS